MRLTNWRRLILLCGVLAIAGCASEPQAVDVAAVRCPPVAASDARTLARKPVAAPSGDVTRAAAQVWIDALTSDSEAKRRAGGRLIRQYEQCRGAGAAS
jgi:hypothetical protein